MHVGEAKKTRSRLTSAASVYAWDWHQSETAIIKLLNNSCFGANVCAAATARVRVL